MKCHNAPYTTNEKYATRILRKGEYTWRDVFGYVVYRFMSIGDRGHLYTPLSSPSSSLISPDCRYWVKWIDPFRGDLFIVPFHPFKCFGFIISLNEFYFSFISPPLV